MNSLELLERARALDLDVPRRPAILLEPVDADVLAKAKRQALLLAGGIDRRLGGRLRGVRAKATALPHPGALFDAAERLDLQELGRAIRARKAHMLEVTERAAEKVEAFEGARLRERARITRTHVAIFPAGPTSAPVSDASRR